MKNNKILSAPNAAARWIRASKKTIGKNKMKELVIIVAAAENGVIGQGGKIPWHFKEDFQRFKQMTLGYPCIMGRKTYESLPSSSRPLPGRENIVLTRSPDFNEAGVVIKSSLEDAIRYCKGLAFIIGGQRVYEEGMKFADRIELTRVKGEYEGDTFFPKIDESVWELVSTDDREKFSFMTYVRRKHDAP